MLLHEGKALYPVAVEDRAERARYLVGEIRAADAAINERVAVGLAAVRELYDGAYWRELGYDSFAGCIAAEFGVARATGYRWLARATYESRREIASEKPKQLQSARERRARARVGAPTKTGQSPAQSPTDAPTAILPGDSAPLSLPTSPFPGLRRFLVEQDGRGWRLIVAFRDAHGATQLASTFHAAFADACATLARRWTP